MQSLRTIILITLLALLSASAQAQVVSLAAGYDAEPIALPFLYTGGNIAADPAHPDRFYISSDFFREERVYLVDLGDPMNPAATLVADGTVSQAMNGQYDNHFGSSTVIPLSPTRLIISDNDFGTSMTLPGVLGRTILIAEDLNTDGDFLDVGEISELADPSALSTSMFKGALGPDGRAYFTTAEGAGNGKVLAINQDGTGLVAFATGLDYGAGIGFLTDGRAVIGNADDSFVTGSVVLASDTMPANGVATDPGEATTLTGTVPPVADLAVAGDEIFAAVNSFFSANKVVRVHPVTAAVEDLIAFNPNLAPFGNFVTTVAFDSSAASFAPGPAATPGRKMLVHDYSLGLVLVQPTPQSANVPDWAAY